MSWCLQPVDDKPTTFPVSRHHLQFLNNSMNQPNLKQIPDPLDTHTQACVWLHGKPNGLAPNIHVATEMGGVTGLWISQESLLENIPLKILKRRSKPSNTKSPNLQFIPLWSALKQRMKWRPT
ncbi:hypothetical protein O181_039628 [Austropuccinia psidii MF-1]|uniref:Uncharacterized protein n=1 Tax=Austropuccinia psidii MF-1 TaxID=1389203 RepID=A0A9Q3HC53_9BASI|nr:hypothetical protein [Austropuccinia psidii MF-1]